MSTGSTSQGVKPEHRILRYQHDIIEGKPYHAGRLQGEFLKQAGRALISYEPPEPEQTAREMRRLVDEYCPGLTEEIQGVADSLALPFERALFCATLSPAAQGCTHAVALPGITADHHLLVARNYDMGIADTDLRLCTTRIEGRFRHLGFSDMCFGRLDGINEHGLCVTLSNTWDRIPEEWREPQGLHYAFAVRAALEQSKCVDEAVDLWQRMPIGSDGTLLAADSSGNAARVEIAGRKRGTMHISADTSMQMMVAANHLILQSWSNPSEHIPSPHSTQRVDRFTSWMQENHGHITGTEFKAFLDRDWTTGVSSFSAQHNAGTLWSMVFDVMTRSVEIRFGPPPQPAWHSFSLTGSVGSNEYTAVLPH